ncbi:MAG: hypothetical protein K9L78_00195 [Victivallales bacterium]|nr:hypothetical protein [Victivallales bacterium]MCF7888515.1 hypothetical protein [Victivallales bacterium]
MKELILTMNKIRKKIFKTLSSEKGVSVILALEFTALMLGLILTFVILTQTEKKASKNFNNIKTAKMLSISALRRAIIAMKAYSADDSVEISTLSSHHIISDGDPDSAPYFDQLSDKLPTEINGVNYYEWPANYDPASSDAVTWTYIEKGNGVDSTIIGRIAYVVVSNKGKIDPSATIDSGGNGTPYTEGNDITMIDNAGNPIRGRPGRDASEMYLNSLNGWFTDEYAEKMSVDNAIPNSGELPANSRWIDFPTIFSSLGITDDSIKDSFRNVFNLYSPKDSEAFWIDISNNLYKETSEMYHRFNLARNNWDNLEVDSIVEDDPVPFSESYSKNDVTAIPWIKFWKFPGTDIVSDTMRRQIAANLIDYSDSDTQATTDYPVSDPPTYAGLEKVPYINELKLVFKGWIEDNGPNTRSYLKVSSVDLELLNMYSNSHSNFDAEITLSGSYRMHPPSGGSLIEFNDKTISLNFSCGPETYITENSQNILITTSEFSGGGPDSRIEDFLINELNIKLTEKNEQSVLYDYARLISSTPTASLELSSEGDTGTACMNFQTADPRQNLSEADWRTNAVFCLEEDFLADSDTLDTNNISYNPTIGDDTELDTDPWNISTSYIRNAPMKSPWELGLIHRGAAWQTMNLQKYNDVNDPGFQRTSGGNSYTNGDANILDQIKMSEATENYGKINLNTDIGDVLKVLFQEIYIGCEIEIPGNTGAAIGNIDSATANLLKDATLSANGTNGGSVFYTRAQIARGTDGVSELFTNPSQNTDRTKEEIIGKFINLTKASQPNLYTIIAIGEPIKDIGGVTVNKTGNPISTSLYRFDIGGDEILGTYKIMATVQYDAAANEITIFRYQILAD